MHFLDRRILLITGKGGVGRTTVAAALARAAAAHKRRVLLTEVGDPEGGFSAIGRKFGRETLTSTPTPISDYLQLCHLWGRTGHEEFLRSVLPGGPLIKAALRSRAVEKFLDAAPSFHEMGVFYHLLTVLRAKRADGRPAHELIIIDMPATGHALALTGLPELLHRLIPGGPISTALREGQATLNDPKQGAAWVVTLPEQLPVTEALELLDGLKETAMPAGGVLVNRHPANPFSEEERAALDAWLDAHPTHGQMAFHRIETARVAVERLRAGTALPILTLPEVPADLRDPLPPLTAALSAQMEAEP
ncbi:MAG: arsenic transporter [Myxococcales bacterium]|nr:arsenic transporter [Myxococcales bacterium]